VNKFQLIVVNRIDAHKAAEAEKAEDARKAEEARIAAAVEAERKAGEARAAAAEAHAQPAANDQGEKADSDAGVLGQTNVSAASIPPIPAERPQPDEAMIDGFLVCLAVSPAAKKELRAHLVKWEAYRMRIELAAAA
jgi:hypothetical protein